MDVRQIAPGLLALLLSSASQAALESIELVAIEGGAAPGTTGVFRSFEERPTIDGSGGVGFEAELQIGVGGVTFVDHEGVWASDGTGKVRLVARSGDIAPGTTVAFRSFNFAIAGGGGVVFCGDFARTGSGFWGPDATGVTILLAREGEPAPGTTGEFSFLTGNTAASSGALAFVGLLRQGVGDVSSSNDSAVWRRQSPPYSVELVVREAEPAPGTSGVFSGFGGAAVNVAGEVAFAAPLRSGIGGVTIGNDHAIWAGDGGSGLSLVVREGDPAPGTAGAFRQFDQPFLTASGEVAFKAFLRVAEGDVTAANDTGFWLERNSRDLVLLARKGAAAPGTSGVYADLFGRPVANGSGDAAFATPLAVGPGGVTGDDNFGIWLSRDPGSTTLVVREGDRVPGGDELTSSGFGALDLNELGDLVFVSGLRESSSGALAGNGLFFILPGGPIEPLLIAGETLEVSPGDDRVVSRVNFVGPNFTRTGARGLNDLGEVTFHVEFSDDTQGIFFAKLREEVEVEIDIKPGNGGNPINPLSRGVIPVLVLGSQVFDVEDLNPSTLVFGPAEALLAHSRGPHFVDRNHDGFTDLLAHFRTADTGIAPCDQQACLTGEALDGTPIEGCDAIATVPICAENGPTDRRVELRRKMKDGRKLGSGVASTGETARVKREKSR